LIARVLMWSGDHSGGILLMEWMVGRSPEGAVILACNILLSTSGTST